MNPWLCTSGPLMPAYATEEVPDQPELWQHFMIFFPTRSTSFYVGKNKFLSKSHLKISQNLAYIHQQIYSKKDS